MRRLVPILVVAAAALACGRPAAPPSEATAPPGSLEAASVLARQQGVPVLLEFYSDT